MKNTCEEIRKVTMNLPAKLVDDLLRESNVGLTEMVRTLLEKENQHRVWKKLGALRGKVKFDLTYEQMKEDRE